MCEWRLFLRCNDNTNDANRVLAGFVYESALQFRAAFDSRLPPQRPHARSVHAAMQTPKPRITIDTRITGSPVIDNELHQVKNHHKSHAHTLAHTHALTHSLTHTHTLTHTLTHSLITHSHTHTHSLTHSHTHTLTHTHTHSLTH